MPDPRQAPEPFERELSDPYVLRVTQRVWDDIHDENRKLRAAASQATYDLLRHKEEVKELTDRRLFRLLFPKAAKALSNPTKGDE